MEAPAPKSSVSSRASRIGLWVLGLGLGLPFVALLVAMAIHPVLRPGYFRNFLEGPYELCPADLDAISDVKTAPRYFVRVTGSKAIFTGVEEIEVRKRGGVETSRSVSARYYALVVGDRLLVCKGGNEPETSFEGTLSPLPEDVARRLFSDPANSAARDRFYPFYVDDASFRTPGCFAIALVLGAMIGAGLLVRKIRARVARRKAAAWNRAPRDTRDPIDVPAQDFALARTADPEFGAFVAEHREEPDNALFFGILLACAAGLLLIRGLPIPGFLLLAVSAAPWIWYARRRAIVAFHERGVIRSCGSSRTRLAAADVESFSWLVVRNFSGPRYTGTSFVLELRAPAGLDLKAIRVRGNHEETDAIGQGALPATIGRDRLETFLGPLEMRIASDMLAALRGAKSIRWTSRVDLRADGILAHADLVRWDEIGQVHAVDGFLRIERTGRKAATVKIAIVEPNFRPGRLVFETLRSAAAPNAGSRR